MFDEGHEALIQVLRVLIGSKFDVVDVKEVCTSRLKSVVKLNLLLDGTHEGQALDDDVARN